MKALRYIGVLATLVVCHLHGSAQETFPVNGPRNTAHNYYAFTHANIVKAPGEIIEHGVLLIRDERIKAIGKDVEIPANAVIIDLDDKYIYPSFIDLDSDYGLPAVKSDNSGRRSPQYESKKKGAYNWNEAVHPETAAVDEFHSDKKNAEALRKMGFGAVLTHVHDGIMRGTSALVNCGEEGDQLSVIEPEAAQHFSFSKGRSKQAYPSSQMGAIALIRQTLYDAQWYASENEVEEVNLSLEALNAQSELPILFESTDYLSSLRAARIAREFEKQFIIRGSGDEYRRLDEVKASGMSFVLPLDFPLPYDVKNAHDATDLSLRRMQHWELAPFNARLMHENEIPFAFTANKLGEKDFSKSLKEVHESGLSEADILRALTEHPAQFLGKEDELGKLEVNYYANFLIFTEPFLDEKSALLENWVNGKRYVIEEIPIDVRGDYNLSVNKSSGIILVVEGDLQKPKAHILKGGKKWPVVLTVSGNEIGMRYNLSEEKGKEVILSGNINDNDSRIWVGKGEIEEGEWIDWAAIRERDFNRKLDSAEVDTILPEIPRITYPIGAYGFDSLPDYSKVIIKNATVWTNEDTGIVENLDVCIKDGKIHAIGKPLTKVGLFGEDNDVEVIDAKGKHLTSGIIDEHSHIAISRGVNEGGQASSAEVSIGDVVNSDDVNIYRQLSGGVTASQLLHGSANPIGGQSALIKMRWGMSPEEMKIENADGFIKFALGENVKQSNWGDQMRIRYPQTRMGVEQVYYDAFYRAREYGEMKKIYESGLKKNQRKKNAPIPPRKDLELETVLEILNSERFITCHSYVQSEINMLMHVADSMGFRVNTFTHILEGYKVADKMKAHGVGASTFSDWWAYKYEVRDAIPYNAAILIEQDVVTAINSDDAEMGRRLNQEAGKVVKYGGISEEEAWKTVTLNPAKLLHLDDRMGSIKVGKDADLVLWSDHPMSVNARAEKTYVDGRLMYDLKRYQEMREAMKKERARLIRAMIDAANKKGKSQKVKKDKENEYHCNSEEEDYDAID